MIGVYQETKEAPEGRMLQKLEQNADALAMKQALASPSSLEEIQSMGAFRFMNFLANVHGNGSVKRYSSLYDLSREASLLSPDSPSSSMKYMSASSVEKAFDGIGKVLENIKAENPELAALEKANGVRVEPKIYQLKYGLEHGRFKSPLQKQFAGDCLKAFEYMQQHADFNVLNAPDGKPWALEKEFPLDPNKFSTRTSEAPKTQEPTARKDSHRAQMKTALISPDEPPALAQQTVAPHISPLITPKGFS